MTDRIQYMKAWLDSLGYRDYTLTPASEDASFRSYQRLQVAGQSWVVMDAPPERELCEQFIVIADRLRAARLNAPEIIEKNLELGFLLLTDFGSVRYLSVLNAETEALLYGDALSALLQMQIRVDCDNLPIYSEALLNQEMDLFHDWFLQKMLGIELTESQLASWRSIKQDLVDNALAQPQVFVHRDFHSSNLMMLEKSNPGILDFQDAVKGPITYDLVSVLRDCYINWPSTRVDQLVHDYYDLARVNKLIDGCFTDFMHWFNLMGVQRHLKAIGIFARLKIRDGKPGYIKDIPRTLEYIRQVSADETSMAGLSSLITELSPGLRMKAFK
ncbi:MAG: phosphotransferase [Gammaproteobacteria bacterium]|nr:phosphotransferase [Gammaproteobacteria bacterium]